MFRLISILYTWYLDQYRKNPRKAAIEIAIVLGINAAVLAVNVLVIGLPLGDMFAVKIVNILAKGPLATHYFAIRDWLYARQTPSRLRRMGMDMVAWGLFQTSMYGAITSTLMGVFWLIGSEHFQFPTTQFAQSVALVWVTSTFVAGPVTTFRDDIAVWCVRNGWMPSDATS